LSTWRKDVRTRKKRILIRKKLAKKKNQELTGVSTEGAKGGASTVSRRKRRAHDSTPEAKKKDGTTWEYRLVLLLCCLCSLYHLYAGNKGTGLSLS
jgi:hypothetical protein